MSERSKLTAISKAWSQKDKADFSKGVNKGGSMSLPSLTSPKSSKPKQAEPIVQDEYSGLDEAIANTQKKNLANPGVQDRLNTVAAARSKFYGEGEEPKVASKPKKKKPEVYSAEE